MSVRFVLVCAATLLGGAMAVDSALAKSKAFCRGYAEDFANRSAGSGGAGLDGTMDTSVNLGLASGTSEGNGDVSYGNGGAGGGDDWRRAYRSAYSECRAS
jgi:hypothetical protein